MANQGMYRAPGPAAGLPLPRARLTAYAIVVIVLAVFAVLSPEILFALVERSPSMAWLLFCMGGKTMWLLLLLDLACPIGIAVLGCYVLRGRRAPPEPLLVIAALPYVVALYGNWAGQKMAMAAIVDGSVGPEQKIRFLPEGFGELMANDIFGGFVACGAAIVAAVAAASALATIDVAAITRGGSKPSSLGAAAAGGVWILAALVIGVLRLRHAGELVLLPIFPVIVLVVCAVLAGRGAAVLRAWHDRAEASRGVTALVVAACCALLAVLALQRGIESSFISRALLAMARESLDPAERAAILGGGLEATSLSSAAFAIHVVLGGLTFVLALGNVRSLLTMNAAMAVGLVGILAALTFEVADLQKAAPRIALARADPPGVTLPVIGEMFSDKGPLAITYGGDRVVVAKNGTGEGDLTSSMTCIPERSALLYADAASTLAMIGKRLPTCLVQVTFAVTRSHPPEIYKRLGDYAPYLETTAYITSFLSSTWSRTEDDEYTLKVRSLADDAIEIEGARMALPIPATAVTSGNGQIRHIMYFFRSTDTVEHAIATMAAVETLYGDRLFTLVRNLVTDDGRGPAVEVSGVPTLRSPTLTPGVIEVNGRLPTEAVERVVRQNFGRLRLCYELGLRRDPTLSGRITAKYVIDRTGRVSTATDGGSDLPDANVVACVVNAFGAIRYPPAGSGTVTVVYPIMFSPTSPP